MAAAAAAPKPAAKGAFANASLYVGDLDPFAFERELYNHFNGFSPVMSVRVCRDQFTRNSLGYGYVNYNSLQQAIDAMTELNYTKINGKPIRIMLSRRDPSLRKSGLANIFIKNLDASIDNKDLQDTFSCFGNILSCKLVTDGQGNSKGYGFIQFEHEEGAAKAIKGLNGMLLNDKQVYVGFFLRRDDRVKSVGSPKFTNVYVKNFSKATNDEDLKQIFGKFGPITSAFVMKDANGSSRGFGFVNFQNPDDAAAAVEDLNGIALSDEKVWYVGKAQRKTEREAELKAKFQQESISRVEMLQGANLYLKNLDDSVDDAKLRELFSEYGTITSSRVMLDAQKRSKGCGFVAFSTPAEAAKAMVQMNGKMVGRKPLYVAIAERKEERKSRLQAQFSTMAPGLPTTMPSSVPGFFTGPHRLAPQQFYFGQGPPGSFPPQPPAYGFQPQMVPGIRPGIPHNFLMPYSMDSQNNLGQYMGGRRVGGPQQIHQHGGPQQIQQQMVQRNTNQGGARFLRNAKNEMNASPVPPQGMSGSMMPPMPLNVMPTPSMEAPRPGPIPIISLASALASATPDQQRTMLGDQLYPLVERLEPVHVAEVTGMFLEMDKTEVLHLLESPDALKKKVEEAMMVFHPAQPALGDAADQSGSLKTC